MEPDSGVIVSKQVVIMVNSNRWCACVLVAPAATLSPLLVAGSATLVSTVGTALATSSVFASICGCGFVFGFVEEVIP